MSLLCSALFAKLSKVAYSTYRVLGAAQVHAEEVLVVVVAVLVAAEVVGLDEPREVVACEADG